MASVVNDGNGRRRVSFTGLDRKRRSLRLGKISENRAHEIRRHVEVILSCAGSGTVLEQKTADWIGALPDEWHQKLAAVGLVDPRTPAGAVDPSTIGPFSADYLAKRTDIKPASRLVLHYAIENLTSYFKADRTLASITAGECDDFKRWLATGSRKRGKSVGTAKAKGLSPATISKRLQWCCAIFRDAQRRNLIADNPFAGLKRPKMTNPERKVYVPVESIILAIGATADPEWKLLLALSRYLGLRVPSEPFSLTWDCVDWDRGRLRVPSPKTAVHGKSYRVVPILPEVRPFLEALFFHPATEGRTHVFHRLRQRGATKEAERGFWGAMNLRQQFLRLLERASVQPWPKLFHNLRASAQTDLASRFPIHVVCDWLGNTQAVAQEHYLQTTDQHFTTAIGQSKEPVSDLEEAERDANEKATRNPTRAVTESTRIQRKSDALETKKPLKNRGSSSAAIARHGFEP